jgi:hypothetical protein
MLFEVLGGIGITPLESNLLGAMLIQKCYYSHCFLFALATGWQGRWIPAYTAMTRGGVAVLGAGWREAWGSDPNSGQRCLRSAEEMNEIGL